MEFATIAHSGPWKSSQALCLPGKDVGGDLFSQENFLNLLSFCTFTRGRDGLWSRGGKDLAASAVLLALGLGLCRGGMIRV